MYNIKWYNHKGHCSQTFRTKGMTIKLIGHTVIKNKVYVFTFS